MIDTTVYFTGGGSTPVYGLDMTREDMKEHMQRGDVFGVETPDGTTWFINPANLSAVHVRREYGLVEEDA